MPEIPLFAPKAARRPDFAPHTVWHDEEKPQAINPWKASAASTCAQVDGSLRSHRFDDVSQLPPCRPPHRHQPDQLDSRSSGRRGSAGPCLVALVNLTQTAAPA